MNELLALLLCIFLVVVALAVTSLLIKVTLCLFAASIALAALLGLFGK